MIVTSPSIGPAMPRHALLAPVLALVLLGGACADDAGRDEAAPAATVEGSFFTQAEEVCLGHRVQVDAERSEPFDDDELIAEDAQQSFERAGALLATMVQELRGLPPPVGADEQQVAAWLDAVEEAARAYQAAGESAQEAEELMAAGDPLVEAEEMADELGMEACGTDPPLPTDELGDPQPVPTED
jgi:hypothetical protein